MLRAILAGALMLPLLMVHAACGTATTETHRIDAGGGQSLIVSARDEGRASRALEESTSRLNEWLGPRRSGQSRPDTIVTSRLGSVPSTMDVESAVAFAVARSWWPSDAPAEAAALIDGAAWYLQSRIVETLFDYTYFRSGHSADRVALFGGWWTIGFEWLPLDRWTAGVERRDRASEPRDRARARSAHAFATLERLLTWPVLQGALSAWVQGDVPATPAEVARVIGEAAGQDLGWFFDAAFTPDRTFDYAIGTLASEADRECDKPSCYRTRVSALRLGNAVFTGSSLSPSGPFESGDAVEILVGFSDGSSVTARWDGRASSRDFEFASAAPAVFAAIDPNDVIVIDENHLNNRVDLAGGTNVPVWKWTARWLIWLQDAMLSTTG